jgi:hypothetical protein
MIFNPMQGNSPLATTASITGRNMDIAHNTFGGRTALGPYPGYTLRNNLFYNMDDRAALELIDTTNMISNWNVFSTGPNGMTPAVIKYAGVERTLGTWQTLTSFETNSVQVLPEFVSVDDLHLAGSNTFYCPLMPGVDRDIDGDLRGPLNTHQGADHDNSIIMTNEETAVRPAYLFPNPCDGAFSVVLVDAPAGPLQAEVLDPQGRLVHMSTLQAGQLRTDLDLKLAPGSYIVRLSASGKEMYTQPFVVTHGR